MIITARLLHGIRVHSVFKLITNLKILLYFLHALLCSHFSEFHPVVSLRDIRILLCCNPCNYFDLILKHAVIILVCEIKVAWSNGSRVPLRSKNEFKQNELLFIRPSFSLKCSREKNHINYLFV